MSSAKQNQVMIGTSGYSYPDWQEVFYPPGMAKDQWLVHYAKHFEFCELNFSYYRMPTRKQLEKYLEQPLKYAIKGHRSLTHDRVGFPKARLDFLEAVSLLQQDDHLAAVLLQFPYSFAYTPNNRKYLLQLLEDLTALPLVVEFRHPDWIKDRVFEELKRRSWGISMIDSPRLSGGMPDYTAITSDIAYLRFHGRNTANWWTGDNVSRYDYEYSEDELQEWLPRITDMSKQAKTTYVSFNNHARGQAIKNANQLKAMLDKAEIN
ncbi:MAG: DUF72 domain-containing protein [Candidatus Marinimicrobia bacterium]|nr:DUF72 domain-containing protein [Candidatus Neomarinimicrobiota bacterium]